MAQKEITMFFSGKKRQKTESISVIPKKEDDDLISSLNELENTRKKLKTYSQKHESYTLSPQPLSIETEEIVFSVSLPKEKKEKEKKQTKPYKKPKLEQMYLDFGQKNFGEITCEECGMLYNLNDANEKELHRQYHSGFGTLSFGGWKDEKIVKKFGDDERIVVVSGEDIEKHGAKINSIKNIMDKQLGYVESSNGSNSLRSDEKMYIYVKKKKAVGCVLAEPIAIANKIIVSDDSSQETPNNSAEDSTVRCTKDEVEADCGISRIWVSEIERRKGIASKLLDTLRSDFAYGYTIPKDRCAFTQPTPSGKNFFSKYTGTKSFLVYTPTFSSN